VSGRNLYLVTGSSGRVTGEELEIEAANRENGMVQKADSWLDITLG
jgi:hypothetical protein